jgi:hypothetical protein
LDANKFDCLTKLLAGASTRRGVARLLSVLPLSVLITTFAGEIPEATAEDDDHGSSHRRQRRRARHRRRHGSARKPRKGNKSKKKGCKSQPRTSTCAGKCGTVLDNCGKSVDCGSGCSQCQTCNLATSQCVPIADNTPCDDGNACTQTDTCQGGVCVGANPIVCPPPANPCEVSTCDPGSGTCVTANAPNRTVCGGSGTTSSICCNGTCWDGCCGSDGAATSCQVFITSSVHTGALGGLGGADAICQTRANAAGRPGTYKAWLSTGSESPSTRFRQSGQPYIRVDNTQVAANWAALISPPGDIDATLNVTETGSTFGTIQFAWTNTSFDGSPVTADQTFNCGNWTNDTVNAGVIGGADVTTSSWTTFGTSFCPVDENSGVGRRLYCFQQD